MRLLYLIFAVNLIIGTNLQSYSSVKILLKLREIKRLYIHYVTLFSVKTRPWGRIIHVGNVGRVRHGNTRVHSASRTQRHMRYVIRPTLFWSKDCDIKKEHFSCKKHFSISDLLHKLSVIHVLIRSSPGASWPGWMPKPSQQKIPKFLNNI